MMELDGARLVKGNFEQKLISSLSFEKLRVVGIFLGKGRIHPGQVASSSQGPSLMAEAAMQGANCTLGASWSSVSCSRTLCNAAQLSLGELGFEPVT